MAVALNASLTSPLPWLTHGVARQCTFPIVSPTPGNMPSVGGPSGGYWCELCRPMWCIAASVAFAE